MPDPPLNPPDDRATVGDDDSARATGAVLRGPNAGGLVARGGLVRGTGYAIGIALGLGTSVLLLRYLGVDDYGKYGTIAALMGIVLGITDGGMTAIGARELATIQTQSERERLASVLMALRTMAATAGVLIAVAFAYAAYTPLLTLGAALVGIAIILQSAQGMATVPLLTELRSAPIALFDLVRQGLTLGGVALLVAAGAGLVPFFGLQIPIVAVTLLLTLVVVRRTFRLGFSLHRPHLGHLIRETLPMSIAVVLNSLYLGAMVVVVSLIASDAETGIYAAPARIMETLVTMASVMLSMAIPVLAVSGTADRERFRSGLQLLLQGGTAVASAIAIGLIGASSVIIELIAGSAFAASGNVLRILAIALIGVFANQALQFALVTLKEQRRLIRANAVALVVLVAAGVILTRTYGPNGAAVAVVIGEIALAAMLLLMLARADRSTLPSAGFLVRLAASAAIGGLVLLVPVNAWISSALAVLVFAAAAVATGTVPRHVVRDLVDRRPTDNSGAGT